MSCFEISNDDGRSTFTHSQGIGLMSHVKHLAVLAGTLGAVLLGASTAAAQADFGTQVAEYVRAQEALAADDFEEAQRALADLIAVADGVVGPLARAAAGAGDIESMRSAFKPLSELLAGMDLPAGYARAYCPMYDGGSNWVQVDGPVRNPYYGSMMLTCGVVDAAPGAHMDHSPRHGGASSWRRTASTISRGRTRSRGSSGSMRPTTTGSPST